jgi:hypothetical protein
MGESQRKKTAAGEMSVAISSEQRSNLRTAIAALQKYCRRNDHIGFEVSLGIENFFVRSHF